MTTSLKLNVAFLKFNNSCFLFSNNDAKAGIGLIFEIF